MDKKQKITLIKQIRKFEKELNKLVSIKGFEELNNPSSEGIRRMGNNLSELIQMLKVGSL